ncbi:polyglutamine-binding protein 1 isoform X2 [Bradysia coprophila]|uniref:polyglutamine-binding protein 1 isoform X2 n=1 Tax=Bradysia coprophila TaxID=38358 RepID=UPI00187DA5B0|nr:polyglutamine-binding protein 1 isoform X2 [Bradysia coprophila]
MPLPPALLQKLAKRGLVQKGKTKQTTNASHQSEEIIAEDYDEEPYPYDYEPVKKPMESYWSERLKRRIVDGSSAGYKNCPNKYNIFHKCTLYCVSTYGDGIEPDREYLRRKRKLLQKYPLPKEWKEVFDSGFGVHYYWHTKTDTVSWLPPSHPKATPSKSAAFLRKELEASLLPETEEPTEDIDAIISGENEKESVMLTSPSVEAAKLVEPLPMKPPAVVKKPKGRDLDKVIRSRSERRQRSELIRESGSLDPMDPAAYSDIPRGNWSAGLQQENKKTGADTTASGALYQMRPYPSPSAVLQANKASKKEGNESNSDEEDD